MLQYVGMELSVSKLKFERFANSKKNGFFLSKMAFSHKLLLLWLNDSQLIDR